MRVKVLAVVLAAALGVAAGVVTAVALPSHARDPLHLSIPMVDQVCAPGQSLVVVAHGDTARGLASAAAQYPGSRYLATASSCDTAWQYVAPQLRSDPPADPGYVVYLGPYDTRQACQLRMQHKGSEATSLTDGDTQVVQCLCHVDFADAPDLRRGMTVDVIDNVWIRQLQQLLQRNHLLDRVSGDYDEATHQAVASVESRSLPRASGALDQDSWPLLAQTLCR